MLYCGDLELHATIIVRFDSGGDIKVSQRDLMGSVVQDVNRLTHDGVVIYLLLVAIAKNQDRRLDRLGLFRLSCYGGSLLNGWRGKCSFRLRIIDGWTVRPRWWLLDDDMQRLVVGANWWTRISTGCTGVHIGGAYVIVVIAVIGQRDVVVGKSVVKATPSRSAIMMEACSVVEAVSETRPRDRRNAGKWVGERMWANELTEGSG